MNVYLKKIYKYGPSLIVPSDCINGIKNLNPEDYIYEKFGKRGWQCRRCKNFNCSSLQTPNFKL